MADLTNISPDLLSNERYRQMPIPDSERRFKEWHTEYLRHQKQFLNDRYDRIRELETLRNSVYEDRKRSTRNARQEFLRYQSKFLNEMCRY